MKIARYFVVLGTTTFAFPSVGPAQSAERPNLIRVTVGWQNAKVFDRQGPGPQSVLDIPAIGLNFGIPLSPHADLDLGSRFGPDGGLHSLVGSVGILLHFPRPLGAYARLGVAYLAADVSVDCAIAQATVTSPNFAANAPVMPVAFLSCSGPHRSRNVGLDVSAGVPVKLGRKVACGPVLWFNHSLGGAAGSRTVGVGLQVSIH